MALKSAKHLCISCIIFLNKCDRMSVNGTKEEPVYVHNFHFLNINNINTSPYSTKECKLSINTSPYSIKECKLSINTIHIALKRAKLCSLEI